MVTGVRALSLVRDELFATIDQAEQNLERFMLERHCSSLLQRAVECIYQIRGALSVLELAGAELLAHETFELVTDIPAGAGAERDDHLMALCHSLHVLRRYLEQFRSRYEEMPELLLPAINELRKVTGQPALPECYFFSVRLDVPRSTTQVNATQELSVAQQQSLMRRLRQMYQIGLLGLIKEQNVQASLKLMERALARLDQFLLDRSGARLCWVGAAAIEAFREGKLLVRHSRKQLFSRLDREIRQLFVTADYEPPRSILKDLLYMIALSESTGVRAEAIRNAFLMETLPYTDQMLDKEYRRLTGPSQAVMQSLSLAIHEELTTVKELLDLVERRSAEIDAYARLYIQLGILAKTLVMVGQASAGKALQVHLPVLNAWTKTGEVNQSQLDHLADAILYVESIVSSFDAHEYEETCPLTAPFGQEGESFGNHLLAEAQVLLLTEAKAGLASAKQAISAYLDTRGEAMHLANVPVSLHNVRGALLFLEHKQAAELTGVCAHYVQAHMIDNLNMPAASLLEVLADALSSIEFFLESGAIASQSGRPDILELAADSVSALGWRPVAAA
jgi:hypothetical protein